MDPAISAESLSIGYGRITVVHELDLTVESGELVLLLGPNGAGKTSTVLGLCGELAPMKGSVSLHGRRTTAPLHDRARRGLAVVTEERSVFMGLTTAENLRLARGDTNWALEMFPELRRRLDVKAGMLSGGEQQMLALARALSRKPRVLLADELSLGLAPLIVRRLFTAVRAAVDAGVGVLLVEQRIREVLPYADRVYVMRQGRIELTGTAREIELQLPDVERVYLFGGSGADRDAGGRRGIDLDSENARNSPNSSGAGSGAQVTGMDG